MKRISVLFFGFSKENKLKVKENKIGKTTRIG